MQALHECSRAVIAAQTLPEGSVLESCLRLRAAVSEQMELYDDSLQDYCHILRLHPDEPVECAPADGNNCKVCQLWMLLQCMPSGLAIGIMLAVVHIYGLKHGPLSAVFNMC